jgi:hypothetical protein
MNMWYYDGCTETSNTAKHLILILRHFESYESFVLQSPLFCCAMQTYIFNNAPLILINLTMVYAYSHESCEVYSIICLF